MKYKDNKPHLNPKVIPHSKNKRWLIPGAVLIVAVFGIYLWVNKDQNINRIPTSSINPAKVDVDRLVGRWTRTDSDDAYVIEIKSAAADGKLVANYFNPNPIQVGRAEWQNKNGKLVVVVELRDVNYPGSTYTLNFHPIENRMTGNYYQAVEGTNFNVEFVRAR